MFSHFLLTLGAVNVMHFVHHDSMKHTLRLVTVILDNYRKRDPEKGTRRDQMVEAAEAWGQMWNEATRYFQFTGT